MSSVLIRGGLVVTATNETEADVFVEDQTVRLVGRELNVTADRVIDAYGKYVLPGGIDVHTHLSMSDEKDITADSFATGTTAAAFGGTTTIIDFARQEHGSESPLEALDRRLSQADGQCLIDYGLHMVITGIGGTYLQDIASLPDRGVTSFKLLLAYPGTVMVDDYTAFSVMRVAAERGAIVMLHAENGHVIQALTELLAAEGQIAERFHSKAHPHLTESEATQRGIALAQIAGAQLYVCHVSSRLALEAIESATIKAQAVWAETCPQYLFLAAEDYESLGFEAAKFACSPPIRERANQEHLWRGLVSGAISVVATDHCSYRMRADMADLGLQKTLGRGDFRRVPQGVPGIENRMQLIYEGGVVSGRFGITRFVELTSTNPAKLFGLFPKKGTIDVGSDADILIWNPSVTSRITAKTHHMRVDYNVYEGMTVHGAPEVVISRGEVIVERGELRGSIGRGVFLARNVPQAPVLAALERDSLGARN